MTLSYCNCVLKSENSETSEIFYISRIIHTVSRDSDFRSKFDDATEYPQKIFDV